MQPQLAAVYGESGGGGGVFRNRFQNLFYYFILARKRYRARMQPHRSLDSIEALLIRAAAYVICLGSPRIANVSCEKNGLSCHLGLRIDTYAYADTSIFAGEKERRFNKQVDGICLREITVLVAKEQHRVSLT